jgi:hypothetical protein
MVPRTTMSFRDSTIASFVPKRAEKTNPNSISSKVALIYFSVEFDTNIAGSSTHKRRDAPD